MSRVRPDPSMQSQVVRKIAGGAAIPSVSVIGERELQKVHDLVENPQEQAKQDFQQSQSARHAMSKDRESTWTNTVQASRVQKLQARQDRLAEEERRRCVIDEQERVLQDAKRQQQLDDANSKMYARDPRVVNLNKQLLLNQVLGEREEQLVSSARKKEMTKEQEAEEGARIKLAAQQEAHEKTEQLLSARAKARAEKEAHLQQLEELKSQRRAQIQHDWAEGQEIRRTAEADAAWSERNKQLTRLRNREVAAVQKQQLLESGTPRKSPRERLADRMVEDTHDPEVQKAHEYMLKKTQQAYAAQQSRDAKRQLKNVNRELALENFVNTPRSRTDEAVEAMSSARSISDQCTEADHDRRMMIKRSEADYHAYITDTLAHQKKMSGAGKEQQQARQAMVMQRLADMEAEEALERQEKRLDAQRLQYIHKLQANEKKKTKQKELEEDHKERGVLEAMQAEEDAMFNNYIQAHLPSNMASPLKSKAGRAPDGGRMPVY